MGCGIRAHKAPGKSIRKGMTIIELFRLFPDDATAEKWFEDVRWGEDRASTHCPKCGATERISACNNHQPQPYWCGDCRKHFTVRANSVMHRSHIPLQKWAIAIYMWSTSLKGVSSMKLHRELGITQKSARHLAQKLRKAWPAENERLLGPVEVDDAYIWWEEIQQARQQEAQRRTWRGWEDCRCGCERSSHQQGSRLSC